MFRNLGYSVLRQFLGNKMIKSYRLENIYIGLRRSVIVFVLKL
jgi:hypothetical protein